MKCLVTSSFNVTQPPSLVLQMGVLSINHWHIIIRVFRRVEHFIVLSHNIGCYMTGGRALWIGGHDLILLIRGTPYSGSIRWFLNRIMPCTGTVATSWISCWMLRETSVGSIACQMQFSLQELWNTAGVLYICHSIHHTFHGFLLWEVSHIFHSGSYAARVSQSNSCHQQQQHE